MDNMHLSPHTRWQEYCVNQGFDFYICNVRSRMFEDVMELRRNIYKVQQVELEAIDEYSEHYICTRRGTPVSALRVTRSQAGKLDCEEFIPTILIAKWRNVIGSATRFVAVPEVQACTKVAQIMMEVAWADQLKRGIRLDVINVHERAIKYYGKLGYELVANSFFEHPKWKTPSHVMIFVACPTRCTYITPILGASLEQFDFKDFCKSVRLENWKTFKRDIDPTEHSGEYYIGT